MKEYAFDETLVGAEVSPGYTVVSMIVLGGMIGKGTEVWCFRIQSAIEQNNFWVYEVDIDDETAEPTLTGHRAKVSRDEVQHSKSQVDRMVNWSNGRWGHVDGHPDPIDYGSLSTKGGGVWRKSMVEPKTFDTLAPGDLVVMSPAGERAFSHRFTSTEGWTNAGVIALKFLCPVNPNLACFDIASKGYSLKYPIMMTRSEVDVLRPISISEVREGDILRMIDSPYMTRPNGSFVEIESVGTRHFSFLGGSNGTLPLHIGNKDSKVAAYRRASDFPPSVDRKYKVGDLVQLKPEVSIDHHAGKPLTITEVRGDRSLFDYLTRSGDVHLPVNESEIMPWVEPAHEPVLESKVPAFVHVAGEKGGTIIFRGGGGSYIEYTAGGYLAGGTLEDSTWTLEQLRAAMAERPHKYKVISWL